MAATVRVGDKLHTTLREIANQERRPIGQVIEDAIARYQREKFWRDVETSVAQLKSDPGAWRDYQDDIAELEGGSMDGLVDEDPYYSQEELEDIRAERNRTKGGRSLECGPQSSSGS